MSNSCASLLSEIGQAEDLKRHGLMDECNVLEAIGVIKVNWSELPFHFCVTHPARGSEITYIHTFVSIF